MSNYDYFKHQVAEMERTKAQTVHDEHVIQFRAMCDKKIEDAIPKIEQELRQNLINDMKDRFQLQETARERRKAKEDVNVRVNVQDIASKIRAAIKKAFK